MSSLALLSRVAESVYWMSRYLERAENVARFIDVNLHLMLDLPLGFNQQWQPLVDTSGDSKAFLDRYKTFSRDNVIHFLVFDPENRNSILSCLRSARENARTVRETISSEMWEHVNKLYLLAQSAATRSPGSPTLQDLLYEVKVGCHLFQGIHYATMTHGEAWHFIRLGRMLERGDKTTRILDVKYFLLLPSIDDVGSPYDDIQWSAVLKSVSAFEMYRKSYGRINPSSIVEFLLFDMHFPRSVHHCLISADDSLHKITGVPIGTFSNQAEQALGQARAELAFESATEIIASGLHEFLDHLQHKLNRVDDKIYKTFFALSSL